jgi:protein O-mannosyl-transferase
MIPEKFLDSRIKLLLALLLPAILLYYKSIKYDFTTLDEQWLIVNNADLLNGWKAVKDGFTKSITGLYYRPLLITSVFIDYKIGGLSPTVYHFSNLLMHLGCVLLLFKFLRLNKISRIASWVLSLIFSVHPILLHAVVWVPGRNDLLLCIFTLSSLIFLLRFFEAPKKIYFILHVLFFVGALFTKETAIALPVIYLACYLVYKKEKHTQIWVFMPVWLIIAGAWLVVRNNIVEVPAPDQLSLLEVIKNLVPAMILYTGKAILPVQQSILPLMRNASVIPGLLVIALLLFLIFKPGLRDKKIAGLGLLLFFLILALPVWFSASKNGAEHYEHRIYTAMPGMLLFFSQLNFNYNSRIFKYSVVALIVFFCLKTYLRMPVYKNKTNFVDAGVRECQGNYLFLYQKSELLFNEKNFAGALDYCNQAIAIRPDRSQLYSNRGSIYYTLGFYKSAVSDFNNAIRLSPKPDFKYHLSRAISYEKTGDIKNAVKDLIFVRRTFPTPVPEDVSRVIVEKWARQVDALNQQIVVTPGDAHLYFERAGLYFAVEQEKEGLADLSKACALAPENKAYLKLYMEHYEKQPAK